MYIFLILIIIIFCIIIKYKKCTDNVYYIENFLEIEEFNYIKQYVNNIDYLKNEGFRYVKKIDNDNINNIFYSNKYISKIKKIINNNIIKSNLPIEYRIYPEGSKGMKCHKDTLLYDKPQYEIVFTIENNSDSFTNYYSKNGKNNIIYTKPNSLLIIKANENIHCVSPVSKGYRTILKLVYTQTNNYNNKYVNELKRLKN